METEISSNNTDIVIENSENQIDLLEKFVST